MVGQVVGVVTGQVALCQRDEFEAAVCYGFEKRDLTSGSKIVLQQVTNFGEHGLR